MYSYDKMPASLNGLDSMNFYSYWNTIKSRIADLQALGNTISLHQQKLGVTVTNLKAKGRQDLVDLLSDEIAKTQDDLNKWWKVKGYIDTYLPEWMKADQAGATVVNSLSVLPIVLGAAAIAALAYCVTTGMALLQDYAFKSKLTSAIIEQKMTAGQAAEVLSVPKNENAFESIIGKVGTGFGFGLPVALLVGGGLYYAFVTGMFKNLIPSVSSSTSTT